MDLGKNSGSQEREERISPREGELIKFRDTRQLVVFELLTGDTIEGVVRSYDSISVRIMRTDRVEITLFYHSISFYFVKPRPTAPAS